VLRQTPWKQAVFSILAGHENQDFDHQHVKICGNIVKINDLHKLFLNDQELEPNRE
jgi:hypothetical protein